MSSLNEAEQLKYAELKAAEPEITKMLIDFAEKLGLELRGLEKRVKSESSLTEKLYDRGEKISIENVRDIIRYSIIVPEDKYTEMAQLILKKLSKMSALIYANNYWANETMAYQGINASFTAKNGAPFEFQIHTSNSFDINIETHEDYEVLRTLNKESPVYKTMKAEIDARIQAVYDKNVAIPEHVKTIPSVNYVFDKIIDDPNKCQLIKMDNTLKERACEILKKMDIPFKESEDGVYIIKNVHENILINTLFPEEQMLRIPLNNKENLKLLNDLCKNQNIEIQTVFIGNTSVSSINKANLNIDMAQKLDRIIKHNIEMNKTKPHKNRNDNFSL